MAWVNNFTKINIAGVSFLAHSLLRVKIYPYYHLQPNKTSRIIKSLLPIKDDRPQLLICYYVRINSDKINLYLLNRTINC